MLPMPRKKLGVLVMGDWYLDQRGAWRYDRDAPAPSISATHILSSYSGTSTSRHVLRKEASMADQGPYYQGSPAPSSRAVYNPDLGSDGGGQVGGGALPSIDPDNPVDHVDELRDPAMATLSDPVVDTRPGLADPVPSGASLVACPTCGTGVHPDRLR